MDTKKLVASYYRVSTSNQENEGTIETQISAVRDFAEKNGHTIIKEYTDNGWSGDSIVRPDLDQLRMDAKKKIWQAVIFYDPDRLARRYSFQELVMDELREAGIEVIFVTTKAPMNDEDRIMYGMRGLFSQYERMKIAERFRLGKVRKAKENHIVASEAPYGYTFIKKTGKHGDNDFRQGYYKINETEAKIVKDIFSWVDNDGLTLRSVVRKLQELGIPPRKSKRGVWNTSTLSTLLRNETYIGKAHYGSSYAVVPEKPLKLEIYKKIKKTSRKIRPKEEWIIITTPKIIEEDVFIRVGQRLKTNYEMSSRNTKNEYLLSGKIWCTCGKRRTGEGPKKGKHLYYRCTNRVYSFPLPATCEEGGINARIADSLIWKKIAELMTSPDLLLKSIDLVMNREKTRTPSLGIDTGAIEKEITKLKLQEERYTKAYSEELYSLEQLKEYISPIRDKVVTLESQIAKSKQQEIKPTFRTVPNENKIKEFTEKFIKFLNEATLSFEQKKDIVLSVIKNIVSSREELLVTGSIPITSNYVEFFTSNRYSRLT